MKDKTMTEKAINREELNELMAKVRKTWAEKRANETQETNKRGEVVLIFPPYEEREFWNDPPKPDDIISSGASFSSYKTQDYEKLIDMVGEQGVKALRDYQTKDRKKWNNFLKNTYGDDVYCLTKDYVAVNLKRRFEEERSFFEYLVKIKKMGVIS